jgi:hypothetical protein
MKESILYLFFLFLIIACRQHEEEDLIIPSNKPVLQGGKGGDYSFVVFTKQNNLGHASRIWLKYAADKKPADTSLYDEAHNTITEPGFGPHVHFNLLKKGSYYVHAASQSNSALQADTVIVLKDSTAKAFDFNLQLK